MKPQRIILVRHGESEGNVNFSLYGSKPDHKLVLTPRGRDQAQKVGKELAAKLVGGVHFWVSPYARTRLTAQHIAAQFDSNRIWEGKLFEDPRIREQERGNYRKQPLIDDLERERDQYGTFYYRFPEGESGADVYDRVSTFLDSLYRDFNRESYTPENVVIITHGLTMRLWVMRFFHWTVELFETLRNPHNCQYIRMDLNPDGKYNLTVGFELKSKDEREPPPPAE